MVTQCHCHRKPHGSIKNAEVLVNVQWNYSPIRTDYEIRELVYELLAT